MQRNPRCGVCHLLLPALFLPGRLAQLTELSSKTSGVITKDLFVEDGVDKSPVRPAGYQSLADDQSFKKPDWSDAFYGDPACNNADPMWKALREQFSVEFEMVEETEDMRALASNEFLQKGGYKDDATGWLKTHGKTCFIGIVAVFFQMSRHRIEVESDYRSGVSLWSIVDDQIMNVHPRYFDDVNTVRSDDDAGVAAESSGASEEQLPVRRHWPVSTAEIETLRRKIATMSIGREVDPAWVKDVEQAESCCIPWDSCDQKEKNRCHQKRTGIQFAGSYNGNIFSVYPDDPIDVDPETGRTFTLNNSFKVYVYDVDDPLYSTELQPLTRGAAFCKENQWGFEVELHYWFLSCPCRTMDPQEADFFFVPQYTACHLNTYYYTEEESNAMFESLIPKMEHFHYPLGGKDHIFVWGGGFAVDGPFRNWRNYIKDSIFLMTETEFWNPYDWQDTVPNFVPTKDIVLPGRIPVSAQWEHHRHGSSHQFLMENRAFIGDFVGWNRPYHANQNTLELERTLAKRYRREHRNKKFQLENETEKEAREAGNETNNPNKPQKHDWVREKRLRRYLKEMEDESNGTQKGLPTPLSPRQQLLKWATEHDDMHILQDVPYSEALKGAINSRFCFVPRGKSAWSSRLFRVLYAKCVPVLLNDDYEMPFADMFGEGNMIPDVPRVDNWLVRWPMRKVNAQLAEALRNVPLETLNAMVDNAHYAKCWYSWYPSHLEGSYPEVGSAAGNYTNYVCPEWRTKSAYLAVMKALLRKKRYMLPRTRDRNLMPLSQRVFFFPDPGYTEQSNAILYADVDQIIRAMGSRSDI